MQVNLSTTVNSAVTTPPDAKGAVAEAGTGEIFRGMLHDGSYPAIRQATEHIMQGKRIAPQELLVLQVRVAEYSQKVELCSRCAESVLATARKLQSAQ